MSPGAPPAIAKPRLGPPGIFFSRSALSSRSKSCAVEYPPLASYIERVAEYAVTREWGKRVSWDPAGLQDSQQIEAEAGKQ